MTWWHCADSSRHSAVRVPLQRRRRPLRLARREQGDFIGGKSVQRAPVSLTIAQTKSILSQSPQLLGEITPRQAFPPMVLSNRREAARVGVPPGPVRPQQVFLLASKRCMCGGTDFPQALESLTVVPLRGGDRREDVPFERITPGGVRIAPIADPSDSEVENRNEWFSAPPLKYDKTSYSGATHPRCAPMPRRPPRPYPSALVRPLD